MNDEQLVHLVGYAAIAAVLAGAEWSFGVGSVVGWLFALGVGLILLKRGIDRLSQHLRAEAEAAAARVQPATDGGEIEEGAA